MTEERTGLSAQEAALSLRKLTSSDMDWAQSRKAKFRLKSSSLKVLTLGLLITSTIILGLQQLTAWPAIGFSLVTVGTLLSGIETFANWRSRWVLMEETKYNLNRIRDDIDYYLVKTPPDEVSFDQVDQFYERIQETWDSVSRRWVEFRKAEPPA